MFALIINGLVGEKLYLHCNQKAKENDAPSCYVGTAYKADFSKGATDPSQIKGFVRRIFGNNDERHELLVFSFRSKSIDGTFLEDINDALKFELIDVDSLASTQGKKSQELSACQEVHEMADMMEIEQTNFWPSLDGTQPLITLPSALKASNVFPNVLICTVDESMFLTPQKLENSCGNQPVKKITFNASRKGESPRFLVVGYVESCFVKKVEQFGPRVSLKLIADASNPGAPFFIGLSDSKEVNARERLLPTIGGLLPPPLSLYSFIEFNYGEKNKDPNTLYAYYSNVDTPVNTDLKKAVVRPKVQLTQKSKEQLIESKEEPIDPMKYMMTARHQKKIL